MIIMLTRIVDCTAGCNSNDLFQAAALLKDGQLVAFPTETVYGLGGSAYNRNAIQNIFTAKGRPSDNPLIVHVDSIEMARAVVSDLSIKAEELIHQFWPGPLTLVLPKSSRIPDEITAGLSTVAVRMPDHPVALNLIQACGLPIAAPSANLSGRPSPTSAEHVMFDLQGRIPLILNGGPCREGVESTVLDLSRTRPVILRPGAVTFEMLLPFLPDLLDVPNPHISEVSIPRAPGMKYQHYSPSAPITLYSGSQRAVCQHMKDAIEEAHNNGVKVAVILTQYPCSTAADLVFDLSDPEEEIMLHRTAQELFRCFRECDAGGVHRILLQGVSEKDLGRAVMNRMVKAAKEWIRLDGIES